MRERERQTHTTEMSLKYISRKERKKMGKHWNANGQST